MSATARPEPPTMRFAVLGTSGHIDHGKSTLVKALTGTDPDRLPEEKSRGMTIELGFACLDLPGVRFGIVDVPGHERFVRTMVAGATGVDLAMLVVAADDGPMPQTLEHIEILEFLGVTRGLVVVSKADLADAERLVAVSAQVRDLTQHTALADWPHVAVSAVRGDGLDEIKRALASLAGGLAAATVSATFRMGIDRVFAVRGRGTVVTGSVLCGAAAAGDSLELAPAGKLGRVREVQSHGEASPRVGRGQRAAINLTGIDRLEIERGHELASPGYLRPTRYLDAQVRASARRDKPIASYRRVRVGLATREEMATLVCFGATHIPPGGAALVQLRFDQPVVAAYGQRFILRDETASVTLAGGITLRAVSRRLRPRPDEATALARMQSSSPRERIEELCRAQGFGSAPPLHMACLAGIEPAEVPALMAALRGARRLTKIGPTEVHLDVVAALAERAAAFLRRHHQTHRQEPGVPQDRFIGWLEQRSAPGCGRPLFSRLCDERRVVVRGPFVAAPEFRPALSTDDERLVEQLVAELAAAALDPPEWPKLATVARLSRQRAGLLSELARGEPRLVQVAPQMFAHADAMATFKQTVRELGAAGRAFRLAEVRDRLGLSRRAVLPLLEYLDRTRFTRRVGDDRVLVEPPT